MNTTEIRMLLTLIEYKDWTFEVGDDGAPWLQVRFSDHEGQEWTGRKWRVSSFSSRSEVVQTALKAVLTAEEHEARERFLYRGRAIFGPHFDVEQLWAFASQEAEERRDAMA